jgi:regulation of enolase protein 1 (concanavalin A-like superfamily)
MKPSQNKSISLTTLVVCLLAAAVTTRAQVVTNTFTNPSLDLVSNGVLGSGFDGADLAFGDVPGGNNAGIANGATLAANTGSILDAPGSGFLFVQTINSAWGQGGSGDDGFFAFNIVKGDFTVSVTMAEPFDSEAYVFAGLMARAISDGTGGPYNPTGTNAGENWVSITEFEEFGIPTMSEDMTNGVSDQIDNNGPHSLYGAVTDTNADVYLQIKRTGDTFYLSDSPDGVSWTLEQTIARPDLHGAAMQVGIEEATYTANTPIITFTDYGLVGTNTIKPPVNDPTNIVVSDYVPSGSVNISWTPASGSAGSVVVIRENEPIIQSPYYGFSYVGTPTNGAVINMGGEQQVLYAGSGTNVTVSGLEGSNNVYNLAVYSYTSNGGTTPITYDSSPATNSFNGPGTLTSVSFVTTPASIPVNGVGLAIVTACYSTGDCYNVASSSSITLTVDNPAVLTISGGVMNGLSVGTANVTATYGGVSGTNVVTVHDPVFTDNFSTPHNYITNGLLGTSWDGEYLNFGDVPSGQEFAGAGAGQTFDLDADISNTNNLSLNAAGSSWEGVGDDGPFLFKIVTGDFQASINITTMNDINVNAAGLMARLFDDTGSATQGAAGGNGGETHVNWWKVQNGPLSARYTLDGNAPTDQPGLNSTDTSLLLQRVDSTNFYFYEAPTNNGGVWSLAATLVVPEAANNAPMEVGVAEQMDTGSDGTAQFNTFMLDGVGIVSPTSVQPPPPASGLTVTLNDDLSLTLNWTAESNGVPIQSMVVVRAGAPVNAQPPYGYLFDGGPEPFGVGSDLGDGNWVVYRSPNPPASITNTTVVTGLTPGTVYYAAVYTWVGSSTTKVFDEVTPPTGASSEILDGVLTNIVVLPPPTVPVGGIGQLQVLGYYEGGAVVNVSQFADLTSGNTNIVDTADGVITGYTNGAATVTVTYGGFTNTVNVVVRSPSYADNFTTPHDYLNDGVTATFFDGIYTNFGDVPEQSPATAGSGGSTLDADAGITTAGMLTITNGYSGWEFLNDDGFFLFKYVPGDFQMAIHINNYSDTVNYTIPSIMARAYSVSTNGGATLTGATVGAPLDGLGPAIAGENGECYVRMARFDEYGIGTYPEITIDGVSDQTTQPAQGDGQNWLLLVRQDYTNFNVYQRLTNSQPWHLTPNKTSFSNAKFAGQPMQVGIALADFNSVYGYVQFDSFMLDAALEGTPLHVSSAGGFITVTWPDYPGAVLQSSPSLNLPNWQTVSTAPTYDTGVATVTLPIGNGNVFFRLAQTAP